MSSVIRDSRGNIYAARSDSRLGLEDPLLVELRAVHIAISWAIELNLSNIIFESDNAVVVRLLNKLGNRREDEVGVLVQDCLHHLQVLQHVSIVHAPRACNKAAHTLARQSAGIGGTHIWLGQIPPSIQDIIRADISV